MVAEEQRIPAEEVAAVPAPGMGTPVSFAFSPDDRLVTFLWDPEGGVARQLYAEDTDTGGRRRLLAPPPDEDAGPDETSLEETLRRERRRELGQGITRYGWARYASRLLVPLGDAVYVTDAGGGAAHAVVQAGGEAPVLDPELSPDGTMVAFVQGGELHVSPVEGEAARQLTFGPLESGRTHGLAEFVAQEEMGRERGYWWSRDGSWLAFTEVDEAHVPAYRIVHQGAEHLGDEAEEEHRYPFAGGPNARVRLGVVPTRGGDVTWLDIGEEDCYLARVEWMPDGAVVAQVEDRRQTRLDVLRFDPSEGASGRRLLTETAETWVNLHDLFRPLESGPAAGGFIWASERSGYRHLEVRDGDGSLVRQLTAGPWVVDSLDGVDEEAGLVYFSASKEGPTERHLYVVSLQGGEPRRVTGEAGTHHVVLDHRCRRFVDIHSSAIRQPTATLRSLPGGEVLRVVHDHPDERVERLHLVPPELVTVRARDGAVLHALVHRPSFGAPPYPAVVSVYGGPHGQRVTDSWAVTADMRAQQLRQLGFVVFTLDNRGSARRGVAFESAIGGDLGNLEVQDQVDGVSRLIADGLVDASRVGVYGWSYGGYLAALCLGRAPKTFAAAVAGAPVTHWDGYDTHYTERYMGTPEENPDGYERSSVMGHVAPMRGGLLLVHGLLDENVHFRHTARLLNALIQHRKRFDLLVLPDERHMPRKHEDRVYLEERVTEFLVERLRPPAQ